MPQPDHCADNCGDSSNSNHTQPGDTFELEISDICQARLQAHVALVRRDGMYNRSSSDCKYEDSSSNHPCLWVSMQPAPQYPLAL